MAVIGLDTGPGTELHLEHPLREVLDVLPRLKARLGELQGVMADREGGGAPAVEPEALLEPLATKAAVHLHNALLAVGQLNSALEERGTTT
jgi:hypothetical protein